MSSDIGSLDGGKKLARIADSFDRGENVEAVTVRELLGWFGADYRGPQINQKIREALSKNNLFTKPELNEQHLDDLLKFDQGLSPLGRLIEAKGPMEFHGGQPLTADQADIANGFWLERILDCFSEWWDQHPSATHSEIKAKIDALALLDCVDLFDNKTADIIPFPIVKLPLNQEHASVVRERPPEIVDSTVRIGQLPCANKPPTYVAPNSSIRAAMTIMMHNDFSQLPVMINDRDLKGAVSWRSIGERLLDNANLTGEVRDFMDKYPEKPRVLSADMPLLEAVDEIVKYEYVIVIDRAKKISGIVTLTDVSEKLNDLSASFVLLAEIEEYVRNFIECGNISDKDLQLVRDPRDEKRRINKVSDLTLGESIRILERPNLWEKIRISADKKYFLEELHKIKIIRNNVMHFNPNSVNSGIRQKLERFSIFLRLLAKKKLDQ